MTERKPQLRSPLRLRYSGWSLVVFGLLAISGLIFAWVGPVDAATNDGEDDQFATIEIEVIGAPPQSDRAIADARVTVEAERAISGTLLVVDNSPGQSTTTYEFDIDLAANSVASFPVSFVTGWRGLDLAATLSSNGEVVATDEVDRFPVGRTDGGSIGILGVEAPPQRVTEIGGEQQLSTLVLDDRLRGLERMSSVVATPAAIRDLGADTDQVLQVDAWVRGGGQLIIDGPTRSLDDAYHQVPTANADRFVFGAGSVVYLEEWQDGIPIGGYLGTEALRNLAESQNLGYGSAGELAVLANVALPAVALIAGVLLLYSLIAGPVMFGFLSSKGAQRRMWTILPLLSLIFASAILGYGFISRSGRTEAHITIVEVNERGSRATSNLLLTSSFGGSREFETPPGWSYLGQGRTDGQRPVKLRVGSSSTEVSFDMPPGSNAVARLSGVATEFDGLLTIENATIDGEVVTAQVTNNGDSDLTDAVAFLGNARESIGVIPAGQTVEFTVEWGDHSNRTMKELLIWPRVNRFGGFDGQRVVPQDRDSTTSAGAWTEWRIAQGSTASPDDVLGVVGWSDGYASSVPGVTEGRTALFVRTNVSSVGPEVGFRTVARLSDRQQPIFDGNFSGYVEDYRVTLAPDLDLDRLSIGVTANSSALSVLTEEGWQHFDLPNDGGIELDIPAEALIDGELNFRSYVPEWIWGEGATALIVLDAEDSAAPSLGAELTFRNAGGDFFEEEGGFPPPDGRFGPNQPQRGLEEELRVELGVLPVGEEVVESGVTSSQTHHAYIVTLAEGQSVVATMGSSQGDSYLELLSPEGELLVSNDDYGRGVDSRVEFGADVAGDYEIRAMDLGEGSIDYQIAVEVLE
ncbi:MAG: hypothetical protein ACRBK7_09090 [Acidimicrobiales bacterium]